MVLEDRYYVDEIMLLSCLNVACISVAIYDYLITLSDEINYVWGSKWNGGKILFFLIRYSVFLDMFVKTAEFSPLSANFCQILVYSKEWLFVVGIGMVAIMLALRTWIIYNRRQRIGYFLASILALLWTLMVLVASLNATTKTEFYKYPPGVRNMGCLIIKRTARPDFIYIDVIIGAFEIVIFALTCLRIYRSSWLRRFIPELTGLIIPSQAGDPSSPGGSPVVGVLYRDALLNYVLVLIISNLGLLSVTPIRTDILAPGILGWQRVAHAILGSRTLLHMRIANQVRFDESRQAVSTIHFRVHLDTVADTARAANGSHIGTTTELGESDGGDYHETESWFAPTGTSPLGVGTGQAMEIALVDMVPKSVCSGSDMLSDKTGGSAKRDDDAASTDSIQAT